MLDCLLLTLCTLNLEFVDLVRTISLHMMVMMMPASIMFVYAYYKVTF